MHSLVTILFALNLFLLQLLGLLIQKGDRMRDILICLGLCFYHEICKKFEKSLVFLVKTFQICVASERMRKLHEFCLKAPQKSAFKNRESISSHS